MRRPTRCPRCAGTINIVQGPFIKFACGTTYRMADGLVGLVKQCGPKASGPGPDSDPVHGERPDPPRAARIIVFSDLWELIVAHGANARVGELVTR